MNENATGVLVIGAGMAGLLAAHRLRSRGHAVVVLEKSRGFGGRLATKRIDDGVFDQGAQYFTARDPEFAGLVGRWQAEGWAARWDDGSEARWRGVPAMNAIGKALAEGLEVQREARAVTARFNDGRWCVTLAEGRAWTARALLVTAPVPQAVALLQAGNEAREIPEGVAALGYFPCLALMVRLEGPSALPDLGCRPESEVIAWMADNSRKGVSAVPGCVTLHGAPEFSAQNYERSDDDVRALMLAEAGPLGAAVRSAALHRWRYALPRRIHPFPYWGDGRRKLVLAGDAFGGPRVEGAALSGWAAADWLAGVLA